MVFEHGLVNCLYSTLNSNNKIEQILFILLKKNYPRTAFGIAIKKRLYSTIRYGTVTYVKRCWRYTSTVVIYLRTSLRVYLVSINCPILFLVQLFFFIFCISVEILLLIYCNSTSENSFNSEILRGKVDMTLWS